METRKQERQQKENREREWKGGVLKKLGRNQGRHWENKQQYPVFRETRFSLFFFNRSIKQMKKRNPNKQGGFRVRWGGQKTTNQQQKTQTLNIGEKKVLRKRIKPCVATHNFSFSKHQQQQVKPEEKRQTSKNNKRRKTLRNKKQKRIIAWKGIGNRGKREDEGRTWERIIIIRRI